MKMMEHGMHIIATIPVYKMTQTSSFYKFTSMEFVTHEFNATEMASELGEAAAHSEQILFVLGMTRERKLGEPESTFTPSPCWIVHASAGFSHGTFAIAKSIFRERLFKLLSRVNALTTLVPVSPSFEMKVDERVVQQWASNADFKNQACDWDPVDDYNVTDAQKYQWTFKRNWRLQEEGTNMRKGEYLVKCAFNSFLPFV